MAPKNFKTTSPIDGEKFPKMKYCSSHRTRALVNWINCRLGGYCGKEGRWYEPLVSNSKE